jgi:hypothetical protein
MGHNTGVALLYEILAVVQYSREDKGKAAFMPFLGSFPMVCLENFSSTLHEV